MAKSGKNTESEKDTDLHKIALEQFQRGLKADEHNREQALLDSKFCAGEQWPEELREAREKDNRPCLTLNRMPVFVRQVSNEIRMSPPNIQVLPVEESDIETAEVIEGLIRHIESKSSAKRVYSRAIEDAARSNAGYWRVVTEYSDDKSFNQEIRIKSIVNPLAVIVDPDAADPMLSDADFAFVLESMTQAAFKAKFGDDALQMIVAGDKTTYANDWRKDDNVQVAEYWYREKIKKRIYLLQDGQSINADDYDKILDSYEKALVLYSAGVIDALPEVPQLVLDGDKPKVREYEEIKVYSRLMSGGNFLTPTYEFAANRIPIIPVWGEEFRVGDKRIRKSVITNARDAQMMINYWRTASVETLALAPKAPYLATPKQLEGYEALWQAAGHSNPNVLLYNPDPAAGGRPQREMPPSVNSGILQEAALASDDLKAITGIYDASLGAHSNETSGKAIIARQKEGDISTFVFIDNLHSAIEETGRIILQLIPKIYDAARQIRILGKKDEVKVVKVNQENGIDLTKDGFDVRISTGSSVTTQRQETSEAFVEMLRTAPQLAPVLVPRLVSMLDIQDGKEIAEEIKQVMQPQPQQSDMPQPVSPKDQAQANKYNADAKKTELEAMQMAQAMSLQNQLVQFRTDEPQY